MKRSAALSVVLLSMGAGVLFMTPGFGVQRAEAQRYQMPSPPIAPTSKQECAAFSERGRQIYKQLWAESDAIARNADRTLHGEAWYAEYRRANRVMSRWRGSCAPGAKRVI